MNNIAIDSTVHNLNSYINQLERLFDHHFDAIFFLKNDKERTIINCNQSAIDLLGYEKQDLIGQSICIIHKDVYSFDKIQKKLISEIDERGYLHINDYKIKKRDGSFIPTEHSILPILDETGKRIAWISIIRDITARVNVESKLIYEKLKLHNYLDIVGFLILVIDSDGNIELVNKRACDVLGYDEQELIGKNCFSLLYPPDIASKMEEDYLSKLDLNRKIHYLNTSCIKTKRGRKKIIEWQSRLIIDADGTSNSKIISGKDITYYQMEKEKAELAYRGLQQLNIRMQKAGEEEKEFITTQILDNIGQTLTGFQYELSTLAKQIQKGSDRQQELLISSKLQEMERKTKAIISASRDLSSNFRPPILNNLNFPEVLKWFANGFQEQEDIICDTTEIDLSVSVNKNAAKILFRVCREIFSNIKKHAHANLIELSLIEREGILKLLIKEDGVGIPKAKLESIDSLGILSITENIKSLSGKVSFRSSEKKGTSIFIRIPLK